MSSDRGPAEEYVAFISYCHKPLDKRAAERIQKSIENYRVPAELQDQAGGKRLGRVFRDEDELPAAPDLSAAIKHALDHSRYLITVCTRSFPASRWCEEEVRYFLEHHDRDHILAVLVEGDPEESFSRYMQHRYDEDGNITGDAEPLAANITGTDKAFDSRIYRREITRLAAALIGCSFDALWQREKRSRTNRLMGLMGLGTAVLAAFLFLAVSKNKEIIEQSRALLKQYSNMSVETGLDVLEENDPYAALQIGRNLISEELQYEIDEPRALLLVNRALGSYRYRALRSRILYMQETEFTGLKVTADGQKALVMDVQGTVSALDLTTGKILWSASAGSAADRDAAGSPAFLLAQEKGLVLLRKGSAVRALDLSDGRQVWSRSFEDRISAAWILSPDQETLLLAVCQDQEGRSLLTGLDTGTGAEKGSVELAAEGYELLIRENDPAFSMGLGFSDDASAIACAFYAVRTEYGQASDNADCIYLDISAADWEILHSYVWQRDANADSAIFMGIRPDPDRGCMNCIQYDNVYGCVISLRLDWENADYREEEDVFRLRTRSGFGLPQGIETNYHVVPMLSDSRMCLAFLDNAAFIYDRGSGELQDTCLFEGKVLHARWIDRKKTTVEILTDDGSICRYDFSSGFDFEPGEVELSTYDQDGLRLAEPVGLGLGENRDGFIYLTVGDEKPYQILGVERISDPTIEALQGTDSPSCTALTPSGEKLMSWKTGKTTSLCITDTGTGKLLKEAGFDTPGKEAIPFPLDESSFLYGGKICSADGSIRDLEVPEGYSLDDAGNIVNIRMADGRVLTAADFSGDGEPRLNLCWLDGKLVQDSAEENKNLAFSACTAFAAGGNGWYTGYGICQAESMQGEEAIPEGSCFGAFHAASGKRVLFRDPRPDAMERALAVGTREPVFACAYEDGSIAIGRLDTGEITILDSIRVSGHVEVMCFSEDDRYLLYMTGTGRLNVLNVQDGGLYFSESVDLYGRSASQITGMTCRTDKDQACYLILMDCINEAGGPWIQLDLEDFVIIGEADHVGAVSCENRKIYSCINGELFAFPIHSLDDLRQMVQAVDS